MRRNLLAAAALLLPLASCGAPAGEERERQELGEEGREGVEGEGREEEEGEGREE